MGLTTNEPLLSASRDISLAVVENTSGHEYCHVSSNALPREVVDQIGAGGGFVSSGRAAGDNGSSLVLAGELEFGL